MTIASESSESVQLTAIRSPQKKAARRGMDFVTHPMVGTPFSRAKRDAKSVTELQYRGISPGLLSLRGIAASFVIMAHASNTFLVDGNEIGNLSAANFSGPISSMLNLWVQVLLAPNAAVTFFFVHSGFVLALSLGQINWEAGYDQVARELGAYALRRITRIWPMVFVCCVMAFVYAQVWPPIKSPVLTPWFENFFSHVGGVWYLCDNIFLQSVDLVPFLWSLIIEAYGSMMIPIFFYCARGRGAALFLCVGFALALTVLPSGPVRLLFYASNAIPAFMFAFAVGVMMPFVQVKTRPAWWNSTPLVAAAFIILVLTHHYAASLSQALVIESSAAAVIIYAVYYRDDGALQWFCNLKVIKYVGEISYSMYVNALLCTHVLIMAMLFVLGTAFISRHPMGMNLLAAALAVPATAGLSAATYRWIEMPGMRFGRTIGDIIRGRPSTRSPRNRPEILTPLHQPLTGVLDR